MEIVLALLITIFIFWLVSKIGGGSFLWGAAKITAKIVEIIVFIFVFILILAILL